MKKTLATVAIGALLAATASFATTASADQPTLVIDVPLTTIVEGPLGSEHVLDSADVPADAQGAVCTVAITVLNNDSHREGTDLIVRSGTAALTLHNVESATNPGTHTEGQTTLG